MTNRQPEDSHVREALRQTLLDVGKRQPPGHRATEGEERLYMLWSRARSANCVQKLTGRVPIGKTLRPAATATGALWRGEGQGHWGMGRGREDKGRHVHGWETHPVGLHGPVGEAAVARLNPPLKS